MANCKYNDNESQAIFGVFDGHGGREVAVWCGEHYEDILKNTDNTDTQEWMR